MQGSSINQFYRLATRHGRGSFSRLGNNDMWRQWLFSLSLLWFNRRYLCEQWQWYLRFSNVRLISLCLCVFPDCPVKNLIVCLWIFFATELTFIEVCFCQGHNVSCRCVFLTCTKITIMPARVAFLSFLYIYHRLQKARRGIGWLTVSCMPYCKLGWVLDLSKPWCTEVSTVVKSSREYWSEYYI